MANVHSTGRIVGAVAVALVLDCELVAQGTGAPAGEKNAWAFATVEPTLPSLISLRPDSTAFPLPEVEPRSTGSDLHGLFALYLWVPMQSGDLTVRGLDADVDLGFSDVIELLDDVQGGFMGHFEIGKDRFTLVSDLYYIAIEDETGLPGGELEIQVIQATADVTLATRVGEWKVAGDRPVVVEALGGLRWNDLYAELDPNAVILQNRVSKEFRWFDLVLGARASAALSPSFDLSVRGDLGGFGIGESCDFTWQVAGTLFWHGDHWNAALGYRALSLDYSRGSGTSEFEYDVIIHGPFLGVGYRF